MTGLTVDIGAIILAVATLIGTVLNYLKGRTTEAKVTKIEHSTNHTAQELVAVAKADQETILDLTRRLAESEALRANAAKG